MTILSMPHDQISTESDPSNVRFYLKILVSVFISVLTGFETCNRYEIFNNMNQQVFFVAEGKLHHGNIFESKYGKKI